MYFKIFFNVHNILLRKIFLLKSNIDDNFIDIINSRSSGETVRVAKLVFSEIQESC